MQADIIEDVCAKIPQEERPLQVEEEDRTLEEFAQWLFERALVKPSIEWSRPECRPE